MVIDEFIGTKFIFVSRKLFSIESRHDFFHIDCYNRDNIETYFRIYYTVNN